MIKVCEMKRLEPNGKFMKTSHNPILLLLIQALWEIASQNYTTLQLKLKKNPYKTTIVQLSFGY
jgi:hypothetical protein